MISNIKNKLKQKFSMNLPLKLLYCASFLQYQRFIMPVSFLYYLSSGLTFADFILFQSIFNIACLIAKIPMGYFGDLFSKKSIIIFSYCLYALRVLLWLCFQGFWIILIGEILYGLSKAFYKGNVDSYIYEYLSKSKKEEKMTASYGDFAFYTSLGSALSCFVGVFLYKIYGFKILFLFELFMQILSIIVVSFLPNIKVCKENCVNHNWFLHIKESILSIFKNKNISFFAYYNAVLTGITSVFVWNFQPLLKTSNAPVFFYGAVNVINQLLRSFAGKAADFISRFYSKYLVLISYIFVFVSFLTLIFAYNVKNYILSFAVITFICVAVLFFLVFNIYTISLIHKNTQNINRATTSSTNTFFGDFSSFVFLLIFKYLHGFFGLNKTLLIFGILFLIILFPKLALKFANKKI